MNYGKTYQRETLTVLLASLQEVQNAIRSYDTKAQVVSIGFIFSLGLITTISSLAPELPEFNFILVCFSWLLGVLPIVMFGSVLYPSRSMAPKLGTRVQNLQRSFYLLEERYPTLDDFIAALDRSDWKIEIAYEIQKLSLLRDIKRRRFVWALRITGTSYALMLFVQLLRAASFLK
jgi:hypothetical protein|tara:strand:+ start:480 stop:1007 length:528 start_codon:yes stop_codon:yes gene_type:complete